MIEQIQQWLHDRRYNRLYVLKARGYNWAAGRLLKGLDPRDVNAYEELDKTDRRGVAFDEGLAFNHGVSEAIVDWKQKFPTERQSA
jgi:hypothetical protein